MRQPLRILHVETGMNLYGGALQVHYLLRGLAEKSNLENILVCPEGSAIADSARDHVKSLNEIPMKGDLDLLFVPKLMKIIGREKPDIIHLHSRRGADVLGGIAAKLKGIPCILTRRVDNPENLLVARIKYRLYHRVITISEGIRNVLIKEGVPVDKILCVRSAVDPHVYDTPCDRSWFMEKFGLKDGEFACGVVAQLIERKGHRYLIEAIPGIVKAVPDARFLFFGKGPLENDLRALCRQTGVGDRVIFAGFRIDLERIIGCLDLLIHPALMEGLGVSLLQAAAAGVPIVGTSVGGIPEVLQGGANGYLVPPGDIPSLIENTTKILTDRPLAHQMGEEGRKLVKEHFSIKSMVEGNVRVYRELTGEIRI